MGVSPRTLSFRFLAVLPVVVVAVAAPPGPTVGASPTAKTEQIDDVPLVSASRSQIAKCRDLARQLNHAVPCPGLCTRSHTDFTDNGVGVLPDSGSLWSRASVGVSNVSSDDTNELPGAQRIRRSLGEHVQRTGASNVLEWWTTRSFCFRDRVESFGRVQATLNPCCSLDSFVLSTDSRTTCGSNPWFIWLVLQVRKLIYRPKRDRDSPGPRPTAMEARRNGQPGQFPWAQPGELGS
jgi:hypothetical protein